MSIFRWCHFFVNGLRYIAISFDPIFVGKTKTNCLSTDYALRYHLRFSFLPILLHFFFSLAVYWVFSSHFSFRLFIRSFLLSFFSSPLRFGRLHHLASFTMFRWLKEKEITSIGSVPFHSVGPYLCLAVVSSCRSFLSPFSFLSSIHKFIASAGKLFCTFTLVGNAECISASTGKIYIPKRLNVNESLMRKPKRLQRWQRKCSYKRAVVANAALNNYNFHFVLPKLRLSALFFFNVAF